MPLFTTPTQFLVVALALVAGWFLGLASHSGGRTWRNRYAAERDAHAASRQAAEQRDAASQERIAALERDNAQLTKAPPATAATTIQPAATTAATTIRPGATTAPTIIRPGATTAHQAQRRGWFDWGSRPTRDRV